MGACTAAIENDCTMCYVYRSIVQFRTGKAEDAMRDMETARSKMPQDGYVNEKYMWAKKEHRMVRCT